MIERIYQRLKYNYVNAVERQRAVGLTVMNAIISVGWVLGLIGIIGASLSAQIEINSTTGLIFLITPIIIGFTQRFVLNSALRTATWLFLAFLFIITLLVRLSGLDSPVVITLVLPVVAAGVLLNRRELLFASLVLAGSIFVSAFYQSQNAEPLTYIPSSLALLNLVAVLLSVSIALAFLYVFSGHTEQLAAQSLQNMERLEIMSEFDQQLSKAPDENTVMLRLSELVVERLLYPVCFIHLLDAQGQLNRYVRTGMGTRHAMSKSSLNDENALREAMSRERTLAISLNDDPSRRNHMLPSSRHALAIPLIFNEKVVGALDIQSNLSASPFTDGEQMALRLVASEFTAALMRVRDTSHMQLALQERENVNRRLQTQLADLRGRTERSTGTDWVSYIQGRGNEAFGFDLQENNTSLVAAVDLPAEVRPALLSGEMVVQDTPQGQIINVPILFRNDVLGAMAFTLPPGRVVSERQMEMAKIVSQRLALALENARLVEQSQAQAARERKAGEVASLLIGQQEVAMLINVAAQNFNEALGAIYTRIYLEPEALASQVGEQ